MEESPTALKLRRKTVQVHELEDGSVVFRHGAEVLRATPFRKGGTVRQQDVVDNKYLASTLERIREAQIAADLRRLREDKLTKRQKGLLRASLESRARPEELEGAVSVPPPPPQPLTEPANPYLASVLARVRRDDWQDEAKRQWARRSRS